MPTYPQNRPALIPDYGYVGDLPDAAKIAQPAQKIYQHLRTWRYRGSFWHDSHPPDNSITYDPATQTQNYYPILYGPPRVDGNPRRLAAQGLLWCSSDSDRTSVSRYARWHQPASSGAHRNNVLIQLADKAYNATTSPAYGDETQANKWCEQYSADTFTWDSTYANTVGGFSYGRFRTPNQFAALTFWECPDIELSDAYVRFHPRYFTAGETIRGYEVDEEGTQRTELSLPSVGHLIHHIGDGWEDRDFLEPATRRCMFQWGHGIGLWLDSTRSGPRDNIFGANGSWPSWLYARPRDLRGLGAGTKVECHPAMVISINANTPAGSIIKYVTASGAWWQYEVQGTELTPTLITPNSTGATSSLGTGLQIDLGGELFYIEYEMADAGDELLIHTVSLWEGAAWAAGYWPQTDPATGTAA